MSGDRESKRSKKGKLRNMADINIQVKLQADRAVQGADKLKKSLDRTEKSAKSLQVTIKNSTSAFKVFAGNIAAIGFASLARGLGNAVRGIKDLGFESVQAASDAEETLNKFNVVFAEVGDEATKVADNLAKNFGLAGSKAQELLGNTGDLLSGFGFTGEAALDLSTQVQELAVDLASFTNFSGGAEGASAALTKALLGERESVKSLGISIQEKDVLEQVAINTANGLTFETERQAKAQATLQIALRQSGNAIGDFARSSSSLANLQRILTARFTTFQETIGKELLPAFKAITITLIDFTSRLQDAGAVQALVADVSAAFPAVLQSVSNAIVTVIESYSALEQGINSVIGAGSLIIAQFIDLGVAALDVGIKIKQAFGGDTTGLETLRADLIATSKEFKGIEEASFKANVSIAKSTRETTEIVKTETQSIIDTYNKELEAAKAKTDVVVTGNSAEVESAVMKDSALQELALQKDLIDEERRLIAIENETTFLDELLGVEQNKELRSLEIKKQAAIATIKDKKKLEKTLAELEVQGSKIRLQQELDANAQRASNFKSTLGVIAGLSKSSNSTLFAIGKAAAIAQATINGISAVQTALASAPPPFNFALAALVGAATAANVSKIASQKKPSFQDGGIVPGNSFSGDNVSANVNSGEVILNQQQQAETLFAIANGGGSQDGGREIVVNTSVQVDGNEIARAVSREVADGAILGELE